MAGQGHGRTFGTQEQNQRRAVEQQQQRGHDAGQHQVRAHPGAADLVQPVQLARPDSLRRHGTGPGTDRHRGHLEIGP